MYTIERSMDISSQSQKLKDKLKVIRKTLDIVTEHNFIELKSNLSKELLQLDNPISSLRTYLRK